MFHCQQKLLVCGLLDFQAMGLIELADFADEAHVNFSQSTIEYAGDAGDAFAALSQTFQLPFPHSPNRNLAKTAEIVNIYFYE